MKNSKRAYRRYMKYAHTRKRALNHKHWFYGNKKSNAEFLEEVFKGETALWLRHTGKPCSCDCCSPKYARPTKYQVDLLIKDQLDDMAP